MLVTFLHNKADGSFDRDTVRFLGKPCLYMFFSFPRGVGASLALILALISTFPASAATFIVPGETNPYWSRQWYLRQIQAPEAWKALPAVTKEVIVAVIDAGVDITHPDLKEAIWINPLEVAGNGKDDDQNGFIDDVHGWNFAMGSNNVQPQEIRSQSEEAWSHGTFVASLIGARSVGHVGMVGVNQSVRIMPLAALDGDGFGTIQNVLKAIRYAVNQGASVINLSLAGFDDSEELAEMIARARDAGVLVVAATGNGDSAAGRDIDRQPIYPACFDRETNAVVGVSGTDALDQHAQYANYGARCTDLSAPGYDLFGARPSYPRKEEGSRPAERYLEGMTGTSLAAPLVSGVASLLKAARPDLTVDQLHQLLINNTDNIEATLKPSEQRKMGSGRLNAFKALQAALAVGQVAITSSSSSPVVLTTPTTSTEETPTATSFYFTTASTTLRWLVAPKPVWASWKMEGVQPVAFALVKEGTKYTLKRWLPLTNQETVVSITPPKNQTWTELIPAATSSPSWLLVSSKRELRLVSTSPWKVTAIPVIKGLPAKAKVRWDVKRERFVWVTPGVKKMWEIDRAGRVTSR